MNNKIFTLLPFVLLGIYYFIMPLISFNQRMIYLFLSVLVSICILSKKINLKKSRVIMLFIALIATACITFLNF